MRGEFARLASDVQQRGISVIAINSNDATAFPDDSPEGMRQEASEVGYTFPYLVDDTQEVAKSFRAACTPDFFLFDNQRRLVYRGPVRRQPAEHVDAGDGKGPEGGDGCAACTDSPCRPISVRALAATSNG